MPQAQVVIALKELRVRIKCRATLGKTARLAMEWRDVLADRPIESFQQRGRDARQWQQFRAAEDDAPGQRHAAAAFVLFDHLPITQAWIRHNARFFGSAGGVSLCRSTISKISYGVPLFVLRPK